MTDLQQAQQRAVTRHPGVDHLDTATGLLLQQLLQAVTESLLPRHIGSEHAFITQANNTKDTTRLRYNRLGPPQPQTVCPYLGQALPILDLPPHQRFQPLPGRPRGRKVLALSVERARFTLRSFKQADPHFHHAQQNQQQQCRLQKRPGHPSNG